MIFCLKGKILLKDVANSSVVLETQGGVGYEICVTPSTLRTLPLSGSDKEIKLYISESTAMYGGPGGTSLYGFDSLVDKDIFEIFRSMPSTGAKKSMEYLEKIKKAPADFKNAIIKRDISALSTRFGFRKPTAEKLISNLKEKILEIDFSAAASERKFSIYQNSTTDENISSSITAQQRHTQEEVFQEEVVTSRDFQEALAVLIALGYKEISARQAIDEALAAISTVVESEPDKSHNIDVQTLVKLALKKL